MNYQLARRTLLLWVLRVRLLRISSVVYLATSTLTHIHNQASGNGEFDFIYCIVKYFRGFWLKCRSMRLDEGGARGRERLNIIYKVQSIIDTI